MPFELKKTPNANHGDKESDDFNNKMAKQAAQPNLRRPDQESDCPDNAKART
jgi:hypothetical protein